MNTVDIYTFHTQTFALYINYLFVYIILFYFMVALAERIEPSVEIVNAINKRVGDLQRPHFYFPTIYDNTSYQERAYQQDYRGP